MPKVEVKQVVINEISEKVQRAKSIVLVDARGLTVSQDTVLRKKLRDAGVDYKVYKNTMVSFAIKNTEFAGLEDYLKGPTAVAFSYEEATTAAKIISGELKNMPKLEFKAGVIEATVYDAKGMTAVANIPSKNELLARLLGSFKSPMAAFARFAKALADKDASPAPEAAPAE